MEPADEFLAHYGIMGMKWGKRTGGRPEGTPRSTERAARKDAKEHARAKMYYGEGAGIRRRQINNVVKDRSAKDSAYAEAFERNRASQDMAKAGASARGKRKRVDTTKGVTKTAKGVNHILQGNNQYANMSAVVLVGAATYAHKTGMDKKVLDAGKAFLSDARLRQNVSDIISSFNK